MKTFLAQKYNLIVTGLCKFLVPFFLRKNQLDVKVSTRCSNEIKRLEKSSVVLLLNHSDRFDPLVAAELSRIAGEDFSYIASREQFDGFGGLQGWLLQRCGAYSVLRGEPEDIESKEATIRYISSHEHKLVEFPEGDVTGRDDAVLPLKRDGIKNILEAQQKKMRNGEKDPVYLLPIGIYYEVQKGGIKAMDDCLSRLEKFLELPMRKRSRAQRIERIIQTLITNLEKSYGIETSGSSLDQRLLFICSQVAENIANLNGLQIQQMQNKQMQYKQMQRVIHQNVIAFQIRQNIADEVMVYLHSVRNQLWRALKEDEQSLNGAQNGQYEARLKQETIQRKHVSLADLDKMEQLLILAHTIQQALTTLNHAWRVIDRLEQEITGKSTLKGHRIAYIDSGPLVNLLQFMPAFRGNEDSAINLVDTSIRQKILYVLNRLKSEHAVA